MGVKLACLPTFMLNILTNSQHNRRQYATKSIRNTMLAQWQSSTLCLLINRRYPRKEELLYQEILEKSAERGTKGQVLKVN